MPNSGQKEYSKMIKYKISAVVPVAQYANLQPEIEVEAKTIEEAEKVVLPYIEDFFNKYAEKDKRIGAVKNAKSKTRKLEKDIFSNEIFYDDETHEYTNALGEVYLSGSVFASQSEKPFDGQMISEKMALKHKLDPSDVQKIQDMWALKGEASASLGTAIHAALELYGTYKGLAESLDKETHAHDNPILKLAVDSFYKEHPNTENIVNEGLVVDHAKKRAGRIDRIEKEKDGVFVTDFKTNFNIQKSIKKYWLQLSFYAAILEANGVTVKGLKIYHWNGTEWVTIEHEVIDIDKLKKGKA